MRMWRVAVLLRRRPRTLTDLAHMVGASTRTIRRDLDVLQAAGLPIWTVSREEDASDSGLRSLWAIGDMPEWPKGEPSPLQELRP